jgi:hypothetical protein
VRNAEPDIFLTSKNNIFFEKSKACREKMKEIMESDIKQGIHEFDEIARFVRKLNNISAE